MVPSEHDGGWHQPGWPDEAISTLREATETNGHSFEGQGVICSRGCLNGYRCFHSHSGPEANRVL